MRFRLGTFQVAVMVQFVEKVGSQCLSLYHISPNQISRLGATACIWAADFMSRYVATSYR